MSPVIPFIERYSLFIAVVAKKVKVQCLGPVFDSFTNSYNFVHFQACKGILQNRLILHQIRQFLRDCIICILLFVGFRKVVQNLINSFKVSRLKQISGVLQNHGGTEPRTGLRTWIQGSKFEEIYFHSPFSRYCCYSLSTHHPTSAFQLSL